MVRNEIPLVIGVVVANQMGRSNDHGTEKDRLCTHSQRGIVGQIGGSDTSLPALDETIGQPNVFHYRNNRTGDNEE